ncbi:tRNA (adenine(22)-N(1))-methyltransferase TrmK [Vibrio sp. ZSDE26]|uniref:tRNA1(Val) (adenine(37)-N6)-methyltransferase n=1 Tax=Vibrio amylolyticus TaxID=2847292 RepID=A0A9X1XPP5_9VIBR|nr:methyltransferase [Vibrio amylolyticus]MCK6264850.1 tRNA (adenine(22)-N(1))-methyltransferase TrmK [Vibrio amylolyticus]
MKSSTSKTKDFKFKQFSIYGGESGMPVSTDGVLLGAWSQISAMKTLLDIGTGTGLLSLMAAQRSSTLTITAIDIDQHAIESAQRNFQQSNWGDRIELVKGDILKQVFNTLFDGIICNPPYFNSGEQSQRVQRATARHTDTLDHQQLLKQCFALTAERSTASFILPLYEGQQFIKLAKEQNWHVSRLCYIKPTDKKATSRLLIELSKVECEKEETQLVIHENGQYSDAFCTLTSNFYLKM